MSDSLFDAPTEAAPEAAPATPAPDAPAAPEADGYEDPRLKDIAGGKWKKWDDVVKGYSESSKSAREKAEEAKALAEKATALETKVGGLLGAPKGEDGKPAPYTFELPEGVELDPQHPLLVRAMEIGHERDLAPSVLQPFALAFLEWEAGTEHARREYEDGLLNKAFGGPEGTNAEIKETFAWMSGLLGEDAEAMADIVEAGRGGLAATVKTLSRIRKAISQTGIGHGSPADAMAGKTAYEAWLSQPDHQRGAMPAAAAAYLQARAPGDEIEY